MSGSLECKAPSFMTKKLRSERSGTEQKKQHTNNQASKDDNDRQEEASNFHQGSNPMKRNHA